MTFTTSATHTTRFMAMAAGLACAAHALAQDASGGQPFDINAIRPGQPGVEQRVEVPTATENADTPLYSVSRILLEYRSEHPEHPSMEQVSGALVTLGVVPDGYVAPGGGAPVTTMRIGDIVEASAARHSAGALTQIAKAVVAELNRQGLASVAVQIHPDDIDPETGVDKREGGQGDLRLVVWTGKVAMVRTIASGERLQSAIDSGRTTRVDSDSRVHARIRAQSPVQPGDLMNSAATDDYLFRLNRHPARRVDASVAPGAAEEEIVLDYLVTENRPWNVYAQFSNTGTEQTSQWRTRVGMAHNQLTGADDVLRLDFNMAGANDAYSANASYDFPIRSDTIRSRIYASYSEFEASDVGLAGERFSGQTYVIGGETAVNVYQHRQFFVDLFGGLRWQNIKVSNEVFQEFGQEHFLVPYFGVRAERITDVMTTTGSLSFEFQNPAFTNVDAVETQRLGRNGVDDEWQMLKLDLTQTHYIEPIVSDLYWGTGTSGPTSLAHEVALSLRGQYAFNGRVIPNEQEVAGGFFSVRGYPESVAAGDSALIGSMEYRFHYPHWLGISKPGEWEGKPGPFRDMLGGNFRYAPSEPFGRTDWDLIFKAFVDAGMTDISHARVGENEQTLIGAGLGVEYQFKRYVTARLEWGFALNDVDDPANGVQSGDNRVHLLITVVY
jgi:hemolysin activation/secretion protein